MPFLNENTMEIIYCCNVLRYKRKQKTQWKVIIVAMRKRPV